MIAYNKIELEKAAKQAGFVRDTFGKVLRLKEVLKYINSDAYLREHLALKGGTAINMTIFNLPRLSVDIDLDFTRTYPKMIRRCIENRLRNNCVNIWKNQGITGLNHQDIAIV